MPMTTPRDLFIHELSDAMSAEQQILKMLPRAEERSTQIPEVQQAYRQHEQETQHLQDLLLRAHGVGQLVNEQVSRCRHQHRSDEPSRFIG